MSFNQLSLELSPKNVSVLRDAKLKEANEFITARYKFTLLQLRMFFAIMSVIDEDENTFFLYRFLIRDLAEAVGISTDKGYFKIVKEILSALKKEDITILKRFDDDEEKRHFIETNFISSLEYFGDGTVEIVIEPKLKKYFFNLKGQYTYLELQELLSFESLYAVRLYLLARQFLATGHRKIRVEEFKEILHIKSTYKSFADIRRFVIEPGIKEINAKSFLKVGYIAESKRGVKTQDFILTVARKDKPMTEKETAIIEDQMRLLEELKSHKVHARRAASLIKKYSSERIEENMKYVLSLPEKRNQGAYIAEAIEGDYYAPYREMAATKKENEQNHIEMMKREYYAAIKSGDEILADTWKAALESSGVIVEEVS